MKLNTFLNKNQIDKLELNFYLIKQKITWSLVKIRSTYNLNKRNCHSCLSQKLETNLYKKGNLSTLIKLDFLKVVAYRSGSI